MLGSVHDVRRWFAPVSGGLCTSRKLPKPRPCDPCGEMFVPLRMGQRSHSVSCAIKRSKRVEAEKAERDKNRKAKAERRERRDRLTELKPRGHWIKGARDAFNAFIRERDRDLPCISCGRYAVETFTGGAWDCGHYRTVGAAPELRFNELNAHKQCKSCNSGVRRTKRGVQAAHDPERQATIRAAYRERLIERIGLAAVDELEGPHDPKRYTIEALQSIAKEYRAKTRELKRARAEWK